MTLTATGKRIQQADQITIKADDLVKMFDEALTPTKPLSHHVGRHFTGTFEGFDKGLLHYEGGTQKAWEAVWDMVGVKTPPMNLPPNCHFNFVTLGRKGCDTTMELKGATQSLSGVKMEWDYACVPKTGRDTEQTQYHMTIIPDTRVENGFNRLNVAANGTIIRPQLKAEIS